MKKIIPLFCGTLVVAALAGCEFLFGNDSKNGISNQAPPAAFLQPLEPGASWVFDETFTVIVEADTTRLSMVIEQRNLTRETWFGRVYVVQEERTTLEGDPEPHLSWHRLRETSEGLYLPDIATNTPPLGSADPGARDGRDRWERIRSHLADDLADHADREALLDAIEPMVRRLENLRFGDLSPLRGDEDPGEIRWLAYPMREGREWILRSNPGMTRVVEGIGRVEGVAERAWRVRTESGLFGPEDEVHVHWSARGQVALEATLHGTGTDDSGRPLGPLVGISRRTLRSYQPAVSGGF